MTISAFEYGQPLTWLLKRFKYGNRPSIAVLLGELLGDCLADRVSIWPDAVVPVPLHRQRLRSRGFNQALELSRPLARRFGLAVDYQCCTRIKATAEQAGLPAGERQKNVRSAFQVIRSYERVAIVDDVMTTGATLNELAKAFKRAGARHVQVWTVARAT